MLVPKDVFLLEAGHFPQAAHLLKPLGGQLHWGKVNPSWAAETGNCGLYVGSRDFVHSEGPLVFHSLPGQEVGRKKERKGHLLCFFSSLFLSGVSGLSHCLLTGLPPTNPWRSCLTTASFQICPRRISGSVLWALTVVYIYFTLVCLLLHFSHHEFLERRDHTH